MLEVGSASVTRGGRRATPGAEVISLDEVRQRRLVRRRFAHGLLNAYELVEEERAAA